jgi:hypothetical protein
MVVKSVAFAGELSSENRLKIPIYDSHCRIVVGHWRIRFDSLQVQLTEPLDTPVSVACNLFTSPVKHIFTDAAYHGGRVIHQETIVTWPTPLHSFLIKGRSNDMRQLLAAGQTEWFHFNDASSQVIELLFEDCSITLNPDRRLALKLFVMGILYLECVN